MVSLCTILHGHSILAKIMARSWQGYQGTCHGSWQGCHGFEHWDVITLSFVKAVSNISKSSRFLVGIRLYKIIKKIVKYVYPSSSKLRFTSCRRLPPAMEQPSRHQQTDKTSHPERFLHFNVKTKN